MCILEKLCFCYIKWQQDALAYKSLKFEQLRDMSLANEDTQIETKKEMEYQIPPYRPTHVLSPEFGGTSNYEAGIEELVKEKMDRLEQLRRDPEASAAQIRQAEEDLKTLDNLYENFHIGMNVFRTAKGGRDKLRE
jgi:hypothetical protein